MLKFTDKYQKLQWDKLYTLCLPYFLSSSQHKDLHLDSEKVLIRWRCVSVILEMTQESQQIIKRSRVPNLMQDSSVIPVCLHLPITKRSRKVELPQIYSDSDSSLISPFLPSLVSSQRVLKNTKRVLGRDIRKSWGKHEKRETQKAQSLSFQILFIKGKIKKYDPYTLRRGCWLYRALHLKR